MALTTRELAAFVQKVAKLQPQDPPVYGSARAYSGCSTCIPTLSGFGMGLDSVSWGSVALGAVVGAGALFVISKKTKLLGAMRRAKRSKKKSRKSRRNRRNRRR